MQKGSSEFDFTQLLCKCKEDDYYEGKMVVDRVIGNVNCNKAVRRPKYACGKNSRCLDDTTRPAGDTDAISLLVIKATLTSLMDAKVLIPPSVSLFGLWD